MGCSSGKGKVHIKSLKLAKVGVHSVDAFVDQVEEVINGLADILDTIDERKVKLARATGFNRVSNYRVKHCFVGLLL